MQWYATHPVCNDVLLFDEKYIPSSSRGPDSTPPMSCRLPLTDDVLPGSWLARSTRIGLPAFRIFIGIMFNVASTLNTGALISLPTNVAEGGEASAFSLFFAGEFGVVALPLGCLCTTGSVLTRGRTRLCPDARPRDTDCRGTRSSGAVRRCLLSRAVDCAELDDDCEVCRAIFSSAALRLCGCGE